MTTYNSTRFVFRVRVKISIKMPFHSDYYILYTHVKHNFDAQCGFK